MPTTIQKVEQCRAIGRCHTSPKSYESTIGGWSTPTAKRVAEYALAQLANALAADTATHEANAEALRINAEIRSEVESFMAAIGMPKSYSYRDERSRARYPKTITAPAGYIGDLQRHVITDDGYDHALKVHARLKSDYDRYLAAAIAETEQAAQRVAAEKEAEKLRRLANVALAEIIIRYGLPRESDWCDVLDALRSKDQRIDLAIAGMETRGDWSEGFYRVESALGRFRINTDEDKEIAADICGCLASADGGVDGRVFRDTHWSYDALLKSVTDQQLVADVLVAYENTRSC